MAGVTDKPNRATRRAQAATAPATAVATKPVDAAAAALAGGVVDPAPAYVPAADVVPAPPASAAPDEGTVLPDETLVARPDAPQPIVTAAPPLAAEPDALDVAEQEAAQRGDVKPGDTAQPAEPVVAGQPTLTVERSAIADIAAAGADTIGRLGDDVFEGRTPAPHVDASATAEAFGDKMNERMHAYIYGLSDHPGQSSEPATPTDRVLVIEVIGPPQGRRRAGFAFGPTPRRFLGTQLTDDQLRAIRSDQLLTVGISEIGPDIAWDAGLMGSL